MDIYIKLEIEIPLLRVGSKILLIASLIIYYLINENEKVRHNKKCTVAALLLFMMGDVTFVFDYLPVFFLISTLLFVLGKCFYLRRFRNHEIFEISKIVPFLLISFLFMVSLLYVIYPQLGSYFIPILIYFFIALLLFLFAFLRKQAVNKISFIVVLCGVFSFSLSETITALKMFSSGLPYDDFFIMVFYGVAQYLIVLGLLAENRKETTPLKTVL
ncbi:MULTISPECIES: lysoplasmalogenase [Bizionia]|uniref:lysoplasmalogenase n=1 Tax=Bizionia TaxID=283785 RepID=UPI0014786F78|nr:MULTISPECIES: lysoplasmalogenase [Bizionia]